MTAGRPGGRRQRGGRLAARSRGVGGAGGDQLEQGEGVGLLGVLVLVHRVGAGDRDGHPPATAGAVERDERPPEQRPQLALPRQPQRVAVLHRVQRPLRRAVEPQPGAVRCRCTSTVMSLRTKTSSSMSRSATMKRSPRSGVQLTPASRSRRAVAMEIIAPVCAGGGRQPAPYAGMQRRGRLSGPAPPFENMPGRTNRWHTAEFFGGLGNDRDRHLPAAAARRLRVRRRPGAAALPRLTSACPTSTSRRCCRPCPAPCTGTTCSTTPGSRSDLGGEDGPAWRSPPPPASTASASSSTWCPTTWRCVAPESANAPLWDVLRAGPRRRPRALVRRRLGGRSAAGSACPVLWEHARRRPGRRATCALGEEHDGQPVLRYYDHVFPVALGTEGDDRRRRAASRAALPAGRLARRATTVLNYRRFFDVDALIAVRVEQPDVFEATHRVLLDLNHARHHRRASASTTPTGWPTPRATSTGCARPPGPARAIWVEKILEGDERLPDPGPATAPPGTTRHAGRPGRAGRPGHRAGPATDAWARGRRRARRWSASVDASKRQVVDRVARPGASSGWSAGPARRCPTHDPEPARARRSSSCWSPCEVYRAYVAPRRAAVDALARERLEDAVVGAVAARPDLEPELEQLVDLAHRSSGERTAAAGDFAVRLQQTWGPVMAKGIEDTAFYRWHRLVALNEVGGDPDLLDDATPERAARVGRGTSSSDWPLRHDHAVHARHQAQRGRPGPAARASPATPRAGQRCSRGVRATAADAPRRRPAHRAPALADAGRASADRRRAAARLPRQGDARGQAAHLLDRRRTRTTRRGCSALADRRRWRPATCTTSVAGAVDGTTPSGIRATVLGQKLLQLTLPGVPDTYQGCELVDLSLVDPDNRRAGGLRRAPRPGWPRLRRRRRRRATSTTRSCWSPAGAAAAPRAPRGFGDGGDYAAAARRPPSTRSARVRSAAARASAVLGDPRAARDAARTGCSAAAGATPRSTLPEGQWRDELTGGSCTAATPPAAPTCCADLPGGPAGVPVTTRRRLMREFEVWAPQAAERVELLLGDERRAADPRRRTAGGAAPRRPADGAPLRVQPRRRRPAPRPALAAAAGRPARPVGASSTRPRSPGPTRGWRGVDAARRGDLRAARRHVHRRGHARRGHRAARPPGRPRRRRSSS